LISVLIVKGMISDMVIKVEIADCMEPLDFWKIRNRYIIWFVHNVEQFCSHG